MRERCGWSVMMNNLRLHGRARGSLGHGLVRGNNTWFTGDVMAFCAYDFT